MSSFEDRLLDITANCRGDMHEPDEQGLSALVSGYILDNAFGSDPHQNNAEYTIGLYNDERMEWFNLATLIAYARIGIKSGERV